MSVKKEANGRRSVQIEIEAPGTPEEVWQAIATGPGISAWFVPTEIVEEGGKPVALKSNFGPGMESTATVTSWNPPRKFTAESPGWTPEMPTMAAEWSIEARAGGVCVVRVVHSLFASTDDWDNQLEGNEFGCSLFFRILRLYLTHFRDQRSAIMQWGRPMPAGTAEDAWESLSAALGLRGVGVGQRFSTPAGVPSLGGVVEPADQYPHHVMFRLDKPCPGVANFGAAVCSGTVLVTVSFYLYGDQAADVAARDRPQWEVWMQKHFPMPAEPGKSE